MTRKDLAARLARWCRHDPLVKDLRAAAREADAGLYIVGGPVRDAALGRAPRDLDLAATRRTDALVRALGAIWNTRGFRFRKRGVTTWRFSCPAGPVDIVDASRRGLERDLERRDFSINAIAYDLRVDRILDPCRGLGDLRARRLRMPRPTAMRDDPVRALRAARFVADLPGFRIDRDAASEARRAARGLGRASAERVRDELNKLLGANETRSGLDALDRLDLMDAVLPELAGLQDCVAGPERPDVWRHTLDTIEISQRAGRRRLPGHESARDADDRRVLRWALLLHDISKPETLAYREDGRPTFHGHETLGARRADVLLRRLRLPRRDRKRIDRLIRMHLRPSLLAEGPSTPRARRRLVRESGTDLPLLSLHAACDALGSGGPAPRARWLRLRRLLVSLLELAGSMSRHPTPALVTGRDVLEATGLPAGPRVGELLRRIRDEQESGTLKTRRDALDRLVELAAKT